ncbi:integrase core domain-containing protein [Nocardia africana]|nr:integrase core domain-containing protein [Nocardia africana]
MWSSFKHECYYRHTFATKSELIAAVDNWMHFYNHQRRHSAIGMLSPIDYERSLNAAPEAS